MCVLGLVWTRSRTGLGKRKLRYALRRLSIREYTVFECSVLGVVSFTYGSDDSAYVHSNSLILVLTFAHENETDLSPILSAAGPNADFQ